MLEIDNKADGLEMLFFPMYFHIFLDCLRYKLLVSGKLNMLRWKFPTFSNRVYIYISYLCIDSWSLFYVY